MSSSSMQSVTAALLVVIAAGLVALATPHGIGLSPDSLGYLGGASNILIGKGFSAPPANEPITHVAPLYSCVLALIGLVGMTPAAAAKWLAAGLHSFNTLLVYQLVCCTRIGERAVRFDWIAVGMALLFLASSPMAEIHLMAWTEPAFISLVLGAVWLLSHYLQNSGRGWLLLSGAVISLSILTRYAGLSMWGAFSLVLFGLQRKTVKQRTLDTLLFSIVSLAPFILWSFRNYLAAGTATNRSLVVHLITPERIHQALTTVGAWLLIPNDASGWAKLVVPMGTALGVLCGILLWLRRRRSPNLEAYLTAIPGSVQVAAVAALVYPAFLLFSISFADANTPLDQRILSPLFPLLLIAVAFGMRAWATECRLLGRAVLGSLLIFVCLGHLAMSYPLYRESFEKGLGFNASRWRESPLIAEVRTVEPTGVLYSNAPDALYFHTGRAARKVPMPVSRVTQEPNPEYPMELRAMGEELDKGGVLVLFDLGEVPSGDRFGEVVRDLKLVPRKLCSDGAIFGSRHLSGS